MTESSTPERKRSRSPGYPNFSLSEAIRKAELLYRHDKRNAVPMEVAAQHWGYSPSSSAVLLSVATLKKFGLLDEVGGGAERLVKLTELALHILLADEDSSEFWSAVRQAAMLPQIHQELAEQYGEELPSDSNLKRILILEKGFNDKAAGDLIREYKETISFAGVKASSKMVAEAPNEMVAQIQKVSPQSPAPSQTTTTQNTQKNDGLREYRFPLEDAPDIELRMAAPMTEENFQLAIEQLDAFFKMTRRALIRKTPIRPEDSAQVSE